MKKIISLYSGADGESHLREIEVSFKDVGARLAKETKPTKASEVYFREFHQDKPPDMSGVKPVHGWHAAPFRQLIVVLEGDMTIECADGSKHTLKPGEMLIAEDTTGHGHYTHPTNRVNMIIPLGNEQLV
jgi:hypothetical protein